MIGISFLELFLVFNCQLCGQITDEIVRKLREWNLIPLPGSYKCPRGHEMSLYHDNSTIDGFKWKCSHINKRNNRTCNYSVSIRKKTFFEGSHLSIFQIIGCVNLWSDNCSLQFAMKQLKLSTKPAVDWSNFCREVVFDTMIVIKEQIGGCGKIVEIDESKFGRRKYYRGHRVEGQWVFGGIEGDSGKCFMVPVENRTKETLLAIIKEFILPGTTIISDCWKSYDCLSDEGFIHLTVNHSISFKDSETGAHTNTIESHWRHCKVILPRYHCDKKFFAGYLAKYMFLKHCRISKLDATLEFLRFAGQLYDPLVVKEKIEEIPEENLSENDLQFYNELF